ncbi:MAG TPA: biotin/lipoyl-containing protein [Bradyrhizobium sp.]|nr:biotin/lipoyl-containing protein [Bradyrhizobium sp.]
MVFPSIELVEEIVDLFNRSGASELEFSDASLKFRIRRGSGSATPADAIRAVVASPSVDGPPRPVASPGSDLPVTSFMHGVFHHAPAPGEKQFVSIGAQVAKDQQIGILEAMKVFMPVVAPIDGFVAVIHVENGIEVAVGQPLVTISATPLSGAVS